VLADQWSLYGGWFPFDTEIKVCETDLNYVPGYWLVRGTCMSIEKCHDYMAYIQYKNNKCYGPFPSICFGVKDSYCKETYVIGDGTGGGLTSIKVDGFTSFGLHHNGTTTVPTFPYYRFEIYKNCESICINDVFESFSSGE